MTQVLSCALVAAPSILSRFRFLFSHFNNATSSKGRSAESQVALPLRGHRSSSKAHSSLSRICVDSLGRGSVGPIARGPAGV